MTLGFCSLVRREEGEDVLRASSSLAKASEVGGPARLDSHPVRLEGDRVRRLGVLARQLDTDTRRTIVLANCASRQDRLSTVGGLVVTCKKLPAASLLRGKVRRFYFLSSIENFNHSELYIGKIG